MPPLALLRERGVPLAVATDCNPGTSPMTSLLLAMNMACTLWRLTPLEALRGVTVNAARALGRRTSARWRRASAPTSRCGTSPARPTWRMRSARIRAASSTAACRRVARSNPAIMLTGSSAGSDMEAHARFAIAGAGLRRHPVVRPRGDEVCASAPSALPNPISWARSSRRRRRARGAAEHKQGLGNTAIVLSALRSGAIDVYPEYLGTIDLEILKNAQPTSLDAMRTALRPLGLGVAVPLGFSNGYALAVRGDAGKCAACRTWRSIRT
jgi:hypothetical protein